ncbi:LysM peptidoglycan-binding domain-containing protein [Streptomyces caeni]|uniref:LysM peptidoglycan-binding domain-containing protein n=1 Tax=Streptomyces caeni TaxID=2307231 RepID=A0ABW4IP02_9ACTN
MRIPAFNHSARARRFSVGGAVVAGAFALACTAMPGTAQAASGTPAVARTAAQATGTATYTVKSGDTLFGIARSRKVPGGWQAIAAANKISSPYIIRPGQVLTLPGGSSSAGEAQTQTQTQTYANNLDGWIKQSLAVMAKNGIPGSYNGIYRNIMRESSGNPKAINLWDSNAAAGHPSKGLLQVIQPTFDTYHVPGTSWDIYDPVANITAACNYAYHRYGSIDNVNGPY